MTPASGAALPSLVPDETIFSNCFITGSIDVHSCFIVSESSLWPASRIVAPALCGFGAGTAAAVASSPLFVSFLSPLLLASSFVSISPRTTGGTIDRSVASSAGGGGLRVDDFGARLPPGFDMIRNYFFFISSDFFVHETMRIFGLVCVRCLCPFFRFSLCSHNARINYYYFSLKK